MSMVTCWMPDPDDYGLTRADEPREEYGAWRTVSGTCAHDYCIEADYYHRAYRSLPASPSRDELAEMNADRELVLDETGGRGF